MPGTPQPPREASGTDGDAEAEKGLPGSHCQGRKRNPKKLLAPSVGGERYLERFGLAGAL